MTSSTGLIYCSPEHPVPSPKGHTEWKFAYPQKSLRNNNLVNSGSLMKCKKVILPAPRTFCSYSALLILSPETVIPTLAKDTPTLPRDTPTLCRDAPTLPRDTLHYPEMLPHCPETSCAAQRHSPTAPKPASCLAWLQPHC